MTTTTAQLDWTRCQDRLPPEGVVVTTMICDSGGPRNEHPLVRKGRLWFYPDMSMYVYYTPTHWAFEQGQAE